MEMEEMIPSFITGTLEERIEKWKAYLDTGICIVGSDGNEEVHIDKDKWFEVREITGEDFNKNGFIFCYLDCNKDIYTKTIPNKNNKDVEIKDVKWTHYYISYDKITKELLVYKENDVIFDGTIETNYEFYQLMKQLNIIE